jgi:hypothetical protein
VSRKTKNRRKALPRMAEHVLIGEQLFCERIEC